MTDTIKENYQITMDGLNFDVEIKMEEKELKYSVLFPTFGGATLAFMHEIQDRIAPQVDINTAGMGDAKSHGKLRENVMGKVKNWIENEDPGLDDNTKANMICSILCRSLGLGDIEFLLRDPNLEEIVVNSAKEPVRVYHKKYGWLPSNITLESDEQAQNYAKSIAREIGKDITLKSPLLDAHLPTGDRINAVLPVITDKGTTITIRMFARDPWTFTDFVNNKTVTPDILALIWMMMQYEMNIIISGGTGSGKTSMLNVMMPFIQPNHRVISIEDTRELQLPEFLYWCPMKTRSANSEGEGEVNMSDLLVNALRMRPDRIVLGEIRKGRDAEILFEAMHTGHSVYSTLHADNTYQTLKRLVNAPINVPALMLESIHLNLVMFRDRMKGLRRVYQIAEVIPEENVGGDVQVKPNLLYRWKARTDEIVKAGDDVRLSQEVAMHTGLSKSEVDEELVTKKKIIEWFVEKKVRKLDEIGKLMRAYYLDPSELETIVEKNQDPKKILG